MRSTLIFVGLVLLTAMSVRGYSEEAVYGTLTVVKGDVQLVTARNHVTQPAKAGGRVYPGDVIITGADSRAKITMVDSNVLNISPDSRITIEKYEYDAVKNKKNVILAVDYGKLRSTVNQKYDGTENKYHVKTPSAVAGVRGTDFLVSYDRTSQTSQVVTFRGQVEVGAATNSIGRINSPVRVNPGQATVTTSGGTPTTPAMLPPQQLNNLNHDSSVEGNSSGPNGNLSAPSSNKNKGAATSNGNSEGRQPAATNGNEKPDIHSGSNSGMTPTTADMTDTMPSSDVSRAPSSSPLTLMNPVVPTVVPPLVSPDLIKGGGSHLNINIK